MSLHPLVEKLEEEVAGRPEQLVLVAGTGVALAACDRQEVNGHVVASWDGLLGHGVDYCEKVEHAIKADEADAVRALIRLGSPDFLVQAAEMITSRLMRKAPGKYRAWLKDSLGELEPAKPEILKVLAGFPGLLATLNYDPLFEKATGRSPVTWVEGNKARFEEALRGDGGSCVLHLHGYYENPESVVLGLRSYDRVRDDPLAATILRLFTMDRTLVFVGCRGTVTDPNFTRLIEWAREARKHTTHRHFVLCREEDAGALRDELKEVAWLDVVPYGASFDDLVPFLKRLAARLPGKGRGSGGGKGAGGRASRGGKGGKAQAIPSGYLEWVKRECGSVELLGLRLKQGQSVRIGSVYVPLTTTWREARPDAEEGGGKRRWIAIHPDRAEFGEADQPSDSPLLLDVVNQHSLYVSGAPGSGKSTFCRWLAWLLANRRMPEPELERAEETRFEGLPWQLEGKLPVLIRLRDFHRALPRRRELTARLLQDALKRWLTKERPGDLSWGGLQPRLEGGGVVLILDGADEVPASRRAALVSGLAQCLPDWEKAGNRILLTSRPYGLSDGDVRRLGLVHAPLDRLAREFQEQLVRRWFRILIEDPGRAGETAAGLLRDIAERTWLVPLAENPLLLTAMGIVYGEGKRLPQDRHDLYDRIADTVLHNRFAPEEVPLMRHRLAAIAHGMHTGQGLDETRETPEARATAREIDRLLQADQQADYREPGFRRVNEARDRLLSESGLLLPVESDGAEFHHFSFQEFFAAERIADVDEARLAAVFRERGERPEWRNTLSFLFGNQLAGNRRPRRAVDLLREILKAISGTPGLSMTTLVADCVEILRGRQVELTDGMLDGVRTLCLEGMRGTRPARERCGLGEALGRLGDARFRADAWYLPDEPLLGFVEIPEGPFQQGSDPRRDPNADSNEVPSRTVSLTRYYIGRYPVTVAQFRAFAEDRAENGGFRPCKPDCLRGVANHPVIWVSWDEAMAYCVWLTRKLRNSRVTPEPLRRALTAGGMRMGLPTEAQWEKAARGTDRSVFPWGDHEDPDRQNCFETGIGSTSAVGCFPGGASPFGIEEMSGNVWEWCADWYAPDAYAQGGDSDPVRPVDGADRVIRGGSWLYSARFCRAAYRAHWDPSDGDGNQGFRLAAWSGAPERRADGRRE
ncbi:MAG: SUMF1/EgtB/PvdO family nonheme iron enzyme [Verrucomicrobiae bacterium]|nr:SUMF1/EgtB/PvdO family nonheme iron enzyme [Verrucomicrobiae bacterium]